MRRNLNRLALVLIIVLITKNTHAEEYSTAVGIRLGGVAQGLTVKHFLGKENALEGIVSWGWRSFLITGLYERQQPIANAEGLGWFFGGGLHLGYYNDGYYYFYNRYHHGNKYYYYYYPYDDGPHSTIGLDFIIGLEYKIPKAPLTLGLDLKPFLDFYQGSYFFWDGAFTARYTF